VHYILVDLDAPNAMDAYGIGAPKSVTKLNGNTFDLVCGFTKLFMAKDNKLKVLIVFLNDRLQFCKSKPAL